MDLNRYLRTIINNKIRHLFIKNQCEKCNNKENLHLHHVKLFSEIVEETLNNLNLSYKDANEYSVMELQNITDIVLGKHIQIRYITLCVECHKIEHEKQWSKLISNSKHQEYYEYLKSQKEILKQNYLITVIEPYLNRLLGKKLMKDDQLELMRIINYRINGRMQRTCRKLTEYLTENYLGYSVISKKSDSMRYWEIIKN